MNSKFVLNVAGVRELLQSNNMKRIIQKKVNQVKKSAGLDYEASIQIGRNRIQGRVSANSKKAINKNRKNNVLLKALNSSRSN